MRVAIVGSGLAAISAAKALIARGLKPTILDVGKSIEPELKQRVDEISRKESKDISSEERRFIMNNPTIRDGSPIPKKLVFSSGYFYGKSNKDAEVKGDGPMPPFSYAKGGFSAGWGGAAIPPDDCDLIDWPIKNAALSPYYKKLLDTLPYSAVDDDLSLNFPLYHSNAQAINLSEGNHMLLRKLQKSKQLEKGMLVYGQARLLDYATGPRACQYCGMCMSGCIYGSIYKSTHDLMKMMDNDEVDYLTKKHVKSVTEENEIVRVSIAGEQTEVLEFDKVFLAAGAVNSTRIVLKSKKLFDHKVYLKTRGGFVVPLLSYKKLPIALPNANTQPGLFLEFKVNDKSESWVHTQFSTPNELVYDKLNIDFSKSNLIQSLKKRVSQHLIIAFCNMHSAQSNDYELSLSCDTSQNDILNYRRVENPISKRAIKDTLKKLGQISKKIGCYPLSPAAKVNAGSYHVGCTMPMKINPESEIDTNLLGVPNGYRNVHVVDSSVFPSLPGTTIGLLAMTNAYRIGSEVEL